MLKKVIQVKPNSDFAVYIYFNDGKIKLYDMKSFLNKCIVMNGTLAWDLSGKFDPTNCIAVDPLEQESA